MKIEVFLEINENAPGRPIPVSGDDVASADDTRKYVRPIISLNNTWWLIDNVNRLTAWLNVTLILYTSRWYIPMWHLSCCMLIHRRRNQIESEWGGIPLDKYKQFSSVLKILNSVYVCGWGGGVTAVHCGNLKVSLECYCAQVNC